MEETKTTNKEPTIEEITKSFHPTTKKIINKGNPYNLTLTKNDPSTIDAFFETMSQTSDREGIVNHSYKYYKNYYETLHKENMSDLYVVKVDVKKLKETYQDKITNLEANIEKMSDEKYKDSEKNIVYKKQIPKVVLYEIKITIPVRHQDILGSLYTIKHSFTDFFCSIYFFIFCIY